MSNLHDNEVSDLFTPVKSTGGYGGYGSYDDNYADGGMYSNMNGGGVGDDLYKNMSRAMGWFVSGLVSSIIVYIILMFIFYVFNIDVINMDGRNSSNAVLIGVSFLSLVGGFALAGSIYENWIDCKK